MRQRYRGRERERERERGKKAIVRWHFVGLTLFLFLRPPTCPPYL